MLDPQSPCLGSTTNQLGTKRHNEQDLHQAPTRAGLRHLHWYHWHLQLFGSICESRGLSNLTPSRSRLFKLIGRKGSQVELQQTLAYMVANLRKREREEKQSMVEKLISDQEVILKLPTFKHNTRTMFPSWTWTERDHHGYRRGWFILIKLSVKFSTTGY